MLFSSTTASCPSIASVTMIIIFFDEEAEEELQKLFTLALISGKSAKSMVAVSFIRDNLDYGILLKPVLNLLINVTIRLRKY